MIAPGSNIGILDIGVVPEYSGSWVTHARASNSQTTQHRIDMKSWDAFITDRCVYRFWASIRMSVCNRSVHTTGFEYSLSFTFYHKTSVRSYIETVGVSRSSDVSTRRMTFSWGIGFQISEAVLQLRVSSSPEMRSESVFEFPTNSRWSFRLCDNFAYRILNAKNALHICRRRIKIRLDSSWELIEPVTRGKFTNYALVWQMEISCLRSFRR